MAIQIQSSPKYDVEVQTKQQRLKDIAQQKLQSGLRDEETSGLVDSPVDELGVGNTPSLLAGIDGLQTVDTTAAEGESTPAQPEIPLEQRQGQPQSFHDQQQVLQQQKAAQQREKLRVKPLSEKLGGFEQYEASKTDGFGQSLNRADNFTNIFQNKAESGNRVEGAYLTGSQADDWAFNTPQIEAAETKTDLKTLMFDRSKLDVGKANGQGQIVVDPLFGRVMGLTTENFVLLQDTGASLDETEDQLKEFRDDEVADAETEEKQGDIDAARGAGNEKLGKQIVQQWKRESNKAQGKPTDEYDLGSFTQDDFQYLGTMAKEMYHLANPDFYKRSSNANENQVVFGLTERGRNAIAESRRGVPDAFIAEEIKPATAPRKILDENTESGKLLKRRTTSVVNQKMAKIDEAKDNFNSIAHVVDPTRRKIMWQYGIPILKGMAANGGKPVKEGDMWNIGPIKYQEFVGEYQIKKRTFEKLNKGLIYEQSVPEGKRYNPDQEFSKFVSRFLETMNTTAKYSGKKNHLDFAVQELQSRLHVEQTRMNPQGNPWMRFVTGGAAPAVWKAGDGSDIDLAFKEQMAIHFLADTKFLLPEKRVQAFNDDWKNPNGRLQTLVAQGKQIHENEMNAEHDQKVIDLVAQIAVGPDGSITIPPQLGELTPPGISPETKETILSHGSEGPVIAEALKELYKYTRPGQMSSNMGVEVDGMTHGPATAMATLGIYRGAHRTGVVPNELAGKKIGDFYVPTSGIIREETFKISPTMRAEADRLNAVNRSRGQNRGDAGVSTAYEQHMIESGQGLAPTETFTTSDGVQAGYADYLDKQSGEKVEVKTLAQNHTNFYMNQSTIDSMKRKIANKQIDVVEVVQQTVNGDNVTVNVYGRIPAAEFLALAEPLNAQRDGKVINKYGYELAVPNMRELAGNKQKEGDLRTGMKNYMINNGQEDAHAYSGGEEAMTPALIAALDLAVMDKDNFLKKTPMTLGYGQLVKNSSSHVENTIFSGPQSANILKVIQDNRAILEKKGAGVKAEDVIIDFLHNILVDSINSEMHPVVLEVGQTYRANNFLAMLTNKIIVVDNAIGYKSYIGSKESSVRKKVDAEGKESEDTATLSFRTGADERLQRPVRFLESKPAGSAVRKDNPGGWGRGRIIPALIQGVDGAWMNKMATNSWPKLKDSYMLPIMDAVKTDLKSLKKVREEANKNWFDTVKNYSPVDEVMGKWAPETIKAFRAEMASVDPDTNIDIGSNSDFKAISWLLTPDYEKGTYPNMESSFYDTLHFKPKDSTFKDAKHYDNWKKFMAKQAVAKVLNNPTSLREAPATLKPAEIVRFFDKVLIALDLQARNAKTVKETQARRADYHKRITGNRVLQIDIG